MSWTLPDITYTKVRLRPASSSQYCNNPENKAHGWALNKTNWCQKNQCYLGDSGYEDTQPQGSWYLQNGKLNKDYYQVNYINCTKSLPYNQSISCQKRSPKYSNRVCKRDFESSFLIIDSVLQPPFWYCKI